MIDTTTDASGITTLRLEHGKASALDVEFCCALADAFEGAAADDGTRAVVLTGVGGIFSAGVDLFRIVKGGADYVREFLPALDRAFRAQYTFPKPMVAAVNGHAIAGGAILTLGCDHRIMARGKGRIGTPELLVGVPFPALVVEIMRLAVPAEHLQRTAYAGETLLADEAAGRGLVDEVVEPEVLIERAREVARGHAGAPSRSWELTKRLVRAPGLERAPAGAAVEAEVEAVWCAPETLAAIGGYLERTLGKR